MKDDPDFNIHFAAAVQAKQCVYDHTNVNYTNRNVQDKAWEMISNEVGEPVAECKERWKNIRGCYTRHLKYKYTPGRKKKKPYYLAKYLNFLRPYTRPRTSIKSAASVPTNEFDADDSDSGKEQVNNLLPVLHPKIEVLPIEYRISSAIHNDKVSYNPEYSSSDTLQSTPTAPETAPRQHSSSHRNLHKSVHEDYDKATFAYLKSAVLKHEERLQDPDVSFLMTVLPDMKKMNDSQRRRFKITILEGAVNILDETSITCTLEPMEG